MRKSPRFTKLFGSSPEKRRRRAAPWSAEELETRALMHGAGVETAPLVVAPIVNGTTVSGGEVTTRVVNGQVTTGWPAVGLIGDAGSNFCSGTLIGPRHVLTAAHCAVGVANTAGRFTVGGRVYSTSRVIIHPGYNDSTLANDIAIFELAQEVTGVAPMPINRVAPRVGEILTLVGFGAGGTGTSGHNNDFGIKRVGTTPIDGVTATQITWNFDNNNESNTAPGDSGGPAFLQRNGVYYVAGVTSGGTRDDAGIGDFSFDTRVDAFAAWIDSIVGDSTNPPPPPTDDHANTPGASATALTLNSAGAASRAGVLEKAGDRDVFKLTLTQAKTVTVNLLGQSGLDVYLRLYDSQGRQLAEDDDSGDGTNSHLQRALTAGVYYLSAGAYADTGTGQYTLQVATASAPTAGVLTLSAAGAGSATGAVSATNPTATFRFTATKTGRMTLTTTALTAGFDSVLTVYDSQGRQLATNDDYGGTLNSRVVINVVAGQRYQARVVGYGGSTGQFRLSASTASTTLQANARQANARQAVAPAEANQAALAAGLDAYLELLSRRRRR